MVNKLIKFKNRYERKKTLLLVAVIVTGVSFLLIFANNNINHPVPDNSVKTQNSIVQKWETKIDAQEGVTIKITPLELSPEVVRWKFDIVMDTYSVELNQDMIKSSVLVDDQGKEYKPLGWEGPTGGHHREGVLTFNRITPTPKSVELKIFDIADVVRGFDWQL